MEIDRISELIKKLRKEKDLTQEELGNLLGISGKAVSKWERGENLPDILIIKEILGHKSICSTEIYTHVANKRLRELMQNFNVLDLGGNKNE